MREEIKCFYLDNVNKSDFINAGTKFTKFVYAAKKTNNDSLNKFRYTYFMKSSLQKIFNLAGLPPTEAATALHCLRVYL